MINTLREEVTRLHAEVCSALADPNRILILYSLQEGTKNVTTLVDEIGLSQPTVSRHLKTLRERNMVTTQRDGQSILYSLADVRITKALDLLRAVLADQMERQAALAQSASSRLETDQS